MCVWHAAEASDKIGRRPPPFATSPSHSPSSLPSTSAANIHYCVVCVCGVCVWYVCVCMCLIYVYVCARVYGVYMHTSRDLHLHCPPPPGPVSRCSRGRP